VVTDEATTGLKALLRGCGSSNQRVLVAGTFTATAPRANAFPCTRPSLCVCVADITDMLQWDRHWTLPGGGSGS
jgi:hypothetical protein